MKTVLLAAVKVVLTVGLFALALRSIDLGDVLLHIRRLSSIALVSTLGLLFCQMAVAALRLCVIVGIVGSSASLGKAIRINLIGAFFSQALITFVSGDVLRAMLLHRSCALAKRESIGAVTLDRAIGLLSTLLLVSITAPWAIQLTGDQTMRHSMEALAISGVLLVAGFAMVGYIARHPGLGDLVRNKIKGSRIAYVLLDVISVSRHLFRARRELPRIILSSLVIQIINVAVIFFLINSMGADVSIWQCMLIVPTVMLISLLPFSVAGWGLRESAMATGFSLVHAPTAAAVAASVTFGILTLLISLPGGLLWWSSRISVPSRGAETT